MDDFTRAEYLTSDSWYLREAAILLFGYTPIDDDGFISSFDARPLERGERNQVEIVFKLALRALDAEALAYVGEREDCKVKPADFLCWAQGKGYSIPDDLTAAFLMPRQEAEPGPALSAEQHSERFIPASAPETGGIAARQAGLPGRKPDPYVVLAFKEAERKIADGYNKTEAAHEAINVHFPNANEPRKQQLEKTLRGYLQPSKRPVWAT